MLMGLKDALGWKCGCFYSIDTDGSIRALDLCLKHIEQMTKTKPMDIITWLKNNVKEKEQ